MLYYPIAILALLTLDNVLSFTTPPLKSTFKKPIAFTKTQMVADPVDMLHGIISTGSILLSDASAAVLDGTEEAVSTTVEAVVTSTAAAAPAAPDTEQVFGGVRNASYYATLALYSLSLPGLWSTIKRSTKAKTKQKDYVSLGEAVQGGKDLRQQAGEIMAYMKANNYEVVEAGDVITFRGLVARSKSQAFFLTFCTALGMASLALVLQIQFIDFKLPLIGTPNWFLLCLISPYAGIYYWRSGDRQDDIKVKLSSNDDDTENEITVEGNDEELERMWRALELNEKGMIKVEGLLGEQ